MIHVNWQQTSEKGNQAMQGSKSLAVFVLKDDYAFAEPFSRLQYSSSEQVTFSDCSWTFDDYLLFRYKQSFSSSLHTMGMTAKG